MCNTLFVDKRLGLNPEDEDLNFKDAEDKQWFIECTILETERINAETSKILADAEKLATKARLVEAENEAERLTLSKPKSDTYGKFTVDCRGCGSEFSYEGNNAAEALETFQDKHYQCI
jgi:hypothetical protein